MSRILLFVICSACGFLGGCATPASQAPKQIVVLEDLRFIWAPPIGFPKRTTTISAGTYTYLTTNYEGHIFSAPDGRISVAVADGAATESRGGIAIDKFKGKIYVWQASKTVEMLLPMGPALIHGEGGRDAYPYVGTVPKELLSKIRLEK
ncbi:MAG: hypothetical protein Q8J74_04430 [Candidatus Didemnitutus sp.]|nr:hypothetical protein [Candidatus Didemnitutus sp.]